MTTPSKARWQDEFRHIQIQGARYKLSCCLCGAICDQEYFAVPLKHLPAHVRTNYVCPACFLDLPAVQMFRALDDLKRRLKAVAA